MNLGYLTAIAPTILVLGGIIACCVRFVRKPTPETFLILGALFSFALGILFMSLRVPSYAQVKAFYGLPALVPFCALGAIGLQAIGRGGAVVRLAMWLGLLAWAITSYGSLWIPASSPFTHTVRGVGFNDDGRYAEAAEEFSRALQLEPTSLHARVGLADSLNRLSRREEARQEADRALQLHPDSVEAWLQQGVSLGLDGRYEQAAEFLRRAAGAASDHPTVYQALATCYTRLGQHQKVVEACEHGLRIDPFNPELHYALAVTLTSHGDAARAAEHFQYGLILQPERVEALNNLAWILASNPSDKLRNGQEAVRLAERACELTQQREPTLLGTLAAAYAEAGRFADAVRTGRKAEELAAASGQPEVAEKNRQLIVLYQAGKAYREPR